MNTMIPMLLFASAVAFAPQSAAQKTNQPKQPVASTRVPVDVSLQGLAARGERPGLDTVDHAGVPAGAGRENPARRADNRANRA